MFPRVLPVTFCNSLATGLKLKASSHTSVPLSRIRRKSGQFVLRQEFM